MLESAPSHQLADIISAIVNATFKEKLDVLNSVNLKDRYVLTMTFYFSKPLLHIKVHLFLRQCLYEILVDSKRWYSHQTFQINLS